MAATLGGKESGRRHTYVHRALLARPEHGQESPRTGHMHAAVLVESPGQLRMKMGHRLEAPVEKHGQKQPEMVHGLSLLPSHAVLLSPRRDRAVLGMGKRHPELANGLGAQQVNHQLC